MSRLCPACLLLVDSLDELRQERHCLTYAAAHGLIVISLARDVFDACRLVEVHLVEVILSVWPIPDVERRLLVLGVGRTEAVRPRPVAPSRAVVLDDDLIGGMVARAGGDPAAIELVARLLGKPIGEVSAMSATRRPRPAARGCGR